MKTLKVSEAQGQVLRELADGELHAVNPDAYSRRRRATMECLVRRGWITRHNMIDGRIATVRECALRPREWVAGYVITRAGRAVLSALTGGER
jgi:hypothetical protein